MSRQKQASKQKKKKKKEEANTSKKFFFLFSLQSFPFILFHFQINTLLDRFIYNEVGYELNLKEHSTLISGKEKDLTNWP